MATIEETFFICIYGPSGCGKTAETGYSFPNALFIAAPGALTSVKTVCGYTPRSIPAGTVGEITAILDALRSKGVDTLVVDDFSFVAQQSWSVLEDKGVTGFKLWGRMRDEAMEFRDKARYSGINIVLSCWEQAPKTRTDGTRMRGGPKLTGELPEQIPAMCDVVLRVVHEPQRRPWPMAYKCNPDPSWVMKDRFDVATKCDPAPMNLAELLRARGVHMPRRPEHEKMEDRVDKLASFFLGKTPDTWLDSAQAAAKQLLDAGVPSNEVRWTLRDAMDRAVIRGALAASETNFLGRVH